MQESFLVIPTNAVAGAEKRLFGIWLELCKSLPVTLVAQPSLLEQVFSLPEFEQARSSRGSTICDLLVGSPRHDAQALFRFARSRPPGTIIHHVLEPPVLKCPGCRYLYTFPTYSMSFYSWRGRLLSYWGLMTSDLVDVLDPTYHSYLRRLLFWRRERFRLTPGSYIDPDHYTPAAFEEKKNHLVFLGLWSKTKQVDRLLEALPRLDQLLTSRGHKNLRYLVLGRPAPDVCVETLVQRPEMKNLDLELRFEPHPPSVLKNAKVFLSLQVAENYPSKSLLEALACGVLPVVTDVGHSRRIADPSFAEFIPRDFTPEELAAACHRILALPKQAYQERVAGCLDWIKSRFSLKASIDYFADLYRELAP